MSEIFLDHVLLLTRSRKEVALKNASLPNGSCSKLSFLLGLATTYALIASMFLVREFCSAFFACEFNTIAHVHS